MNNITSVESAKLNTQPLAGKQAAQNSTIGYSNANISPAIKNGIADKEEDTPKKKPINKALIGAAAAIGIAAVTIGAILITKNVKQNSAKKLGDAAAKTADNLAAAGGIQNGVQNVQDTTKAIMAESGKIQSEVGEIQSEAKTFLGKAKKIINEVSDLFKKGEVTTDEGITLRKIENEIMSEFDSTGKKLVRQSVFDDGVPSSIKEFVEGTKKYNLIETDFSGVETIGRDVEELADGTLKMAKKFSFDNGKLVSLEKGHQKATDSALKTAASFNFDNGKLASYSEGYEEAAGGTWKRAKQFSFDNGKLSKYGEGYHVSVEDDVIKFEKEIPFN